MQFGQHGNGGKSATGKTVKHSPFEGIAKVNALAGLDALKRQARLKQAMELRQIAATLGMPPDQLEQEMMAGGNITVNEGRGNIGPWILGSVLLVLLFVGLLLWSGSHGSQPPSVTPAKSPAQPTKTAAAPTAKEYNLGLEDLKVY